MTREFTFKVGFRRGVGTVMRVYVQKRDLSTFLDQIKRLSKGRIGRVQINSADGNYVLVLANLDSRPGRALAEYPQLRIHGREISLDMKRLDLDDLESFYSDWLVNGVPETVGAEVQAILEGKEVVVVFSHDSPINRTDPSAATH